MNRFWFLDVLKYDKLDYNLYDVMHLDDFSSEVINTMRSWFSVSYGFTAMGFRKAETDGHMCCVLAHEYGYVWFRFSEDELVLETNLDDLLEDKDWRRVSARLHKKFKDMKVQIVEDIGV